MLLQTPTQHVHLLNQGLAITNFPTNRVICSGCPGSCSGRTVWALLEAHTRHTCA